MMVVPFCGTMVALCAMVGNFISDGRRFAPGLGRLGVILNKCFLCFDYGK